MNSSLKLAVLGTLATEATLLVLGVLTGSLAARLLLPEGRGALAGTLFWPQLLAGIGLLSLSEAVTCRIGAQPQRASIIKASSLWLATFLAGVTTLTGYYLLPLLLGEGRSHLWSLSRLYLAYIPFNFIALVLLASDQGTLRFGRYNLLRLSVPIVYLVGLLFLWVSSRVSVTSVVAMNCVGSIFAAVLRIALLGRNLFTKPSWEEVRALVRMAGRFHPATVLLLLASQVDQFVVLCFFDDVSLGHYVVAFTVASTGLAVVSGAFQKVLFPHLAYVRDPRAQVELLARGLRYVTLLLVGVSVPLAILTPWLVPWLFGRQFRDAAGIASVLVIAFLVVALKTTVIQCLRGFGDGHAGSLAAAISLGTFLLVVWPFKSTLGLAGVGGALGVANLVSLAYLGFQLRRNYNLTLREFWGVFQERSKKSGTHCSASIRFPRLSDER